MYLRSPTCFDFQPVSLDVYGASEPDSLAFLCLRCRYLDVLETSAEREEVVHYLWAGFDIVERLEAWPKEIMFRVVKEGQEDGDGGSGNFPLNGIGARSVSSKGQG